MCKHIALMLAIGLVMCSLLVCSDAETAEKNSSPIYDQVLATLESLQPDNTIEVKMGVEEERYVAYFQLTADALATLKNRIPADLSKLNEIRDVKYDTAQFVEELEKRMGEELSTQYKSLLLEFARHEIPVYNRDEPFDMRFQVSQDSYVALMHIAAPKKEGEKIIDGGEITFLLPNRQFPDGRIDGDTVYSTMNLFDKHNITTSLPTGLWSAVDTMNLFCSSGKIDLFEPIFGKEGTYTILPSDETRLNTLKEKLEHLKRINWSGKSLKFKIGRDGMTRDAIGKTPVWSDASGALPSTPGRFFPPIGAVGSTGKTGKQEEQNKE